ncbi:ATP-binding protein [Adlercreutzia caecimuris]|uniref:ATP-binding protein n=1 Tax=Adlercreutzia caecimuris B7 TaxID=1235794 RepID=R9KVJ4_9ACTN|nr:DUF4143 domain-containing protein [Adlercreutzia caecimuris]EOS50241.1 hypothetical protein C811_01866 [Adlercreutzia caecimuris B7]
MIAVPTEPQRGNLINAGYEPRVLDRFIYENMEDFGAVCIEGPKYCGKTWTARSLSNSEICLLDTEGAFQNQELARLSPHQALQGAHPRLIDEWQEVPSLWDAVRNAVDRSGKRDTFILTGSAVPRKAKPHHSGVGRIEKVRMRPMTLFEAGRSSGTISLRGLFNGERPDGNALPMSLEDLCDIVICGGWPAVQNMELRRASRLARSYVRQVSEDDLSRVDNVARDPQKISRLLHSLARNAEQAATTKTMIRDMTADATNEALSKETVDDYLQALRRIFVIEEIPGWSPNLRSSIRINKRPKYHYVDPSLPAAILGATPQKLLGDLNAFGFLFECLCLRDLLVYAEASEAQVRYYRDNTDLEVDAIIESYDGKWAALEIKLGHNQADQAAKNLLRLKAKMEAVGTEPPAFLAVVEGLGQHAYVRDDGVCVIPIASLAP